MSFRVDPGVANTAKSHRGKQSADAHENTHEGPAGPYLVRDGLPHNVEQSHGALEVLLCENVPTVLGNDDDQLLAALSGEVREVRFLLVRSITWRRQPEGKRTGLLAVPQLTKGAQATRERLGDQWRRPGQPTQLYAQQNNATLGDG